MIRQVLGTRSRSRGRWRRSMAWSRFTARSLSSTTRLCSSVSHAISRKLTQSHAISRTHALKYARTHASKEDCCSVIFWHHHTKHDEVVVLFCCVCACTFVPPPHHLQATWRCSPRRIRSRRCSRCSTTSSKSGSTLSSSARSTAAHDSGGFMPLLSCLCCIL